MAIEALVVILGFAVITVVFALVIGVVAASRIALALWWSEHPWGGLWIMMPVMMVGAVLFGAGASASGIIILSTAFIAIYASVIWGLRVSWHRSRQKAVLIFLIVMALVAASGVSRWIERDREIRELDQAVLTIIVGAVFWVVAAFIADHVYVRVVARRMPARSPAQAPPS